MTSLSQKEVIRRLNDPCVQPGLPQDVAIKLFQQFKSPVARRALDCLKANDVDGYLSLYDEVNPSNYLDPRSYFEDRIVVSLLRKYPFTGFSARAEAAARLTFLKGERMCEDTNKFFKAYASGRLAISPDVEQILFTARWKIARLLGSFSAKEWLDSGRFGPGNSVRIDGESPYAKFDQDPSATKELEEYVPRILSEYPGWYSAQTKGGASPFRVEFVPGGKYAQVPKDARTNRNIEVQPLVNFWLQRGIGLMLKQRLRPYCNLADQRVNQEWARVGSLDGSIATIDLSNASDTIATELVRWLLPTDWFFAMDLCRTKAITSFEKQTRPLARFSSMGNGFTFELESVIFWALAQSASEVSSPRCKVSVYGDDIIVPTASFDLVSRTLHVCGFEVNRRKSFHSGPFRESCGADWFEGVNVRPLFIKKEIRNVAEVISLANGLRRVAHRLNRNFGYDRQFAPAWSYCLRRIPPAVRRRIAAGFTETDDIILSTTRRSGYRLVFHLRHGPVRSWHTAVAVLLYKQYLNESFTSTSVASSPINYRRGDGSWRLSSRHVPLDHDGYHHWW